MKMANLEGASSYIHFNANKGLLQAKFMKVNDKVCARKIYARMKLRCNSSVLALRYSDNHPNKASLYARNAQFIEMKYVER